MIIDPGQLDRPLTVQRYGVVSTDPQWGDQYDWADHLTVWAMKKRVSEDEIFAAHQEYAVSTVTFVTNWFDDVETTDRLVSEGVTYEVLGIGEIGLKRGLEIKAQVMS